jgi:polysaccharide export outer membrane protein
MRFDASGLDERLARPGIASIVLVALVACAGGAHPPVAPVGTERPAGAGAAIDAEQVDPTLLYRLGSGDKLRVIVFGEEDLSGEFEVDGTGIVSLPLIDMIAAQGLTLRSFEETVEKRLRDGYLKDPRVSAEVLNYRPFYIIGEIEKGGEYPFVNGMNVLNAVALAGGYTYRGNTHKAFITRRGHKLEFPALPETRVYPGDVIRVPERFF